MSTILIYTSPARGHLYPMMDVALALRNSGHRVVVQTLADEADHVCRAGLEHRAIDPRIEACPLEDYRGRNPLAQLRRAFDCWLERAPCELQDLELARAELDPDLLLVDANTWGAAAFAEAEERPWAMFLPYCLPVPSRDAPAFGPGFPPPGGPLGRMRDRLMWAVQHAAVRGATRRLRELRVGAGAQPVSAHWELFERPSLILYRTAPPFDYERRDAPPALRAIGPGLWSPPGEAPDWLGELPRPRILVSVSSERQNDEAIIRAALDGLGGEPGSVIVTTAALDPADFRAPHERVRITRFLPHAAVIPEVDVVVTHGGMGTTQRALAAGVPVVVVPWGRDQGETARRVEVADAGVRLSRGRLTPKRLRNAVRRASQRGAGTARVARGFDEAGGAPRAARLLEALLRTPR